MQSAFVTLSEKERKKKRRKNMVRGTECLYGPEGLITNYKYA